MPICLFHLALAWIIHATFLPSNLGCRFGQLLLPGIREWLEIWRSRFRLRRTYLASEGSLLEPLTNPLARTSIQIGDVF